MKLFVAFVLLSVALLAQATPTPYAEESLDTLRFAFNAWTLSHNKTYATAAEIEHRFQVFQDNLKIVTKHNEEAAKGLHTYTLAMNRFADLTNAEFRARYLTYKPSNRTRVNLHQPSGLAVPTTVDWRKEGAVTGIKDQGQCGSCWSFSTTGSVEGAWKLAGHALVSLSEQNLVDCVNNGQFTCDTGGDMQDAFQYIIDNGGIDTEDSYPYCTCSGNQCAFDASSVGAKISSYKNVVQNSETDLLDAAAAQPISVAIDASQNSFQLYGGGVYYEPACSSTQLDHGVLVIGYGTDSGQAYWLVKNSWGESWGLSGYIMMARNKQNNCGIATDASYPIV